jgi:hypothetical protein
MVALQDCRAVGEKIVRFHYANSAEPLKEGSTITALCGEQVPKAGFPASIDCDIVGYSFAMQAHSRMCRKCCDGNLEKRFVYIVAAGQEARDAE